MATFLVLGGAVAGVYGTGVVLGRRIAPTSDTLVAERPRAPSSGSSTTRAPSTPGETAPGGTPAVPVPDDTAAPPAPPSAPATPGPPVGSTTTPEPSVGPGPTVPSFPPPTTPLPPATDPVAATRQLATSAAGGDVDRVWEMLAPVARVVVGGRPGLAARLTGLHDRLTPVRDGTPLATTTVSTELGVVTVVSSAAPTGEAPLALPFLEVDGRPRLASIEVPTDVQWAAPSEATDDLVLTGPTTPAGVSVGDVPVTGQSAGPGEVRIPVATLPDGPHRAVAVFVDGDRVSASAFAFSLPTQPFGVPEELPVEEEPSP